MDLAVDPGLDVFDVGWSGEVDWVAFRVDPGVGGTVKNFQRLCNVIKIGYTTYGPAVIAGQLCSLHVARPVLRSFSCMHLSMPLRRRFCSTTGCYVSADFLQVVQWRHGGNWRADKDKS